MIEDAPRIMRSKAISFYGLSLILLCLLPSLSEGADPLVRGKLTLKVWSVPDPKATSAPNLADLAVVEEFQRKYPHIQLKGYSG